MGGVWSSGDRGGVLWWGEVRADGGVHPGLVWWGWGGGLWAWGAEQWWGWRKVGMMGGGLVVW